MASEQAADALLWGRGEAAGASEGVGKVSDGAGGRGPFTRERVKAANPGVESAQNKNLHGLYI